MHLEGDIFSLVYGNTILVKLPYMECLLDVLFFYPSEVTTYGVSA
jgi:hypothetical protein